MLAKRGVLWLLAASCLHSQSAGQKLTFEVASVKPSPLTQTGGPKPTGVGSGVVDPVHFERKNANLASLIMFAYGVKPYQVTGPAWLTVDRFDVIASVPEGTTKPQQLVMLQNLLAERFQLALHRESKEEPVYNLVVAKDGPKFKEYVPPADADDQPKPRARSAIDADGFAVLPPGGGLVAMMKDGQSKASLHDNITMARLTLILGGNVDHPVIDQTGLAGTYDIALRWISDRSGAGMAESTPDVGPSIYSALPSQLGLRLERARGKIEVLVVDHAEKPSAN